MSRNRKGNKELARTNRAPPGMIADPSMTVIGIGAQSWQTPRHEARAAKEDIRDGVMRASGLGVGLSEVTTNTTARLGTVRPDRHSGALLRNIIETTGDAPLRKPQSWWSRTADAILYPPMVSLMALAMLEAVLIHEGMPLRFHLLVAASSIGLIYAVWVRR